MQETPVVTVFLRHGTDVLLLRRSDAVGSYQGRWGAVAGYAEGDPARAARQEIREETGIDPEAQVTLIRRGDALTVEDADLDTRWLVTPFLFECETRTVDPNEETSAFEWVPPTEIRRRETVPELWTSYDRVRPSVETVAGDTEQGSASLSIRALDVLRDEAALAAEADDDRGWSALVDLARTLVDARPAMAVLATRVDRAMSRAADAATPAALETAAAAGLERALSMDDEAAARAGARIEGARVATLSRSGTVLAALDRAGPEAVLVAESRPGGEGVGVASTLADRHGRETVTLTTDAAFAAQLATWDADALLVGADAVFADGSVRNKVGTRGAAIAATHAGVDVLVVTASDKIVPETSLPGEPRPEADLTDDPRVAVANPTFDVTRPRVLDTVVTEDGVVDAEEIEAIAASHVADRAWRH
jgi:translation initiation factor 2B subunit (eIF-2B alpha/beta/delta family)/ADP-ribose pyrophosphatase YjhB (NUDIX family)